MYQVFDNNKQAQFPDCKVDPSWNNSKFNSFNKANEYVNNWLHYPAGTYLPLRLGVPFDYSGMGDYIEIRIVNMMFTVDESL